MDEPPAEVFDVPSLEEARAEVQRRTGESYLEFLCRDSMSCGLYVLEAGGRRPPGTPPGGRGLPGPGRPARLQDGRDHPVAPGSVLFVARTVPHRFHDIIERLWCWSSPWPRRPSDH